MRARSCENAVLAALFRSRMTVSRLARETGFAKRSVQLAIQRLHGDKVHIAAYVDSDGRIAYPAPVYALGKRDDATVTPRSNAVRAARSKAKRRPASLENVWHKVAAS